MGGGLPPHKRQLATLLISEDTKPQQIVDEVGCSRRTVFYYKSNLKAFGDTVAPSISKVGRPRALTEEMVDVCLKSL